MIISETGDPGLQRVYGIQPDMPHLKPFLRTTFLILFCSFAFSQTRPPLQITSPRTGTVVMRGQTVYVSVAAAPSITTVAVISQDPLGLAVEREKLRTFSFTIPLKAPIGKYYVTAIAPSKEPDDLIESENIMLDVESPLPIVNLQVNPRTLELNPGVALPLNVLGTFSDDSQADLARSSHVTYTAENPAVATVSDEGWVTGVEPGHTTVIVRTHGMERAAIVIVQVHPQPANETVSPPPCKPALCKL